MSTVQEILQAKSQTEVRKLLVPLQLPDGTSKNKLAQAIWNCIQKTATPEERELVRQTFAKPIVLKATQGPNDVDHPESAQSSIEPGVEKENGASEIQTGNEVVRSEPEPVQEASDVPQPDTETVESENASQSQPEAPAAKTTETENASGAELDDKAWTEKAIASLEKSLPSEVPKQAYQEVINQLKTEGAQRLDPIHIELINRVIQHQDKPKDVLALAKAGSFNQLTKDDLKRGMQELEAEMERSRKIMRSIEKNLNKQKPEKKAKHVEEIAEYKVSLEEQRKDLELLKTLWESILPEPGSDESQPWFGRVYANCTGYIIKNTDETFKTVNKDIASTYLRGLGISQERDTPTTSPLDRALLAIHDRYSVDWAGALAGYRPGLINHGGNRILITKGPKLIEPVPGEFSTIRDLIEGMLGDQAVYFYGWLHLALKPLYSGRVTKGQGLVIAGPINSGKSVLQNLIITPLLGGRTARPYAFMVKRTDFNEDWFESEHLMFEDEAPPRDYETQQLVAGEIKNLIANDDHWCHGKGKKAVSLPPFWRFSASVNDSPEHLRVIPLNDETLKDKMHVLRAYPDATVKLVESLGGQGAFGEAIKEERPAFIHWVLDVFEIPEELRATRFGMIAHQNEEIVKSAEEEAAHVLLLEYLRAKVYPSSDGLRKSLTDIAADLQDMGAPRTIVPAKINTLGKYLSSITRMTNEVKKKSTNKANFYEFSFAGDPPPEK